MYKGLDMIEGIRHTGIVVRNLDKMKNFYESLGFEEVSRNTETGDFIEKVTGINKVRVPWVKLRDINGHLIELLFYENNSKSKKVVNSDSNNLGISHIAFTVKDIKNTIEKIISLGGNVINPPAISEDGKVKVSYCHDIEGVLMEIVEVL